MSNSRILGQVAGKKGETAQAATLNAQTAKSSSKKQDKKRKKGECNYCHKLGHFEAECRKKKADKEKKKGDSSGGSSNTKPTVNAMIAEVASTSNEIAVSWYLESDKNNRWMLDSGCSHHITPNRSDFSDYTQLPHPEKITIGDGRSIPYFGTGTVKSTTIVEGKRVAVTLERVLYAPKAAH